MPLPLPIKLADIPAGAPRWTDAGGSVWAEIGDDHLVLVEHDGRPVPFADPIPRATVTRQHGQLTAVGVPVAKQAETPDPAVTRVLHALAAELHQSLCGCKDYPAACVSKPGYRRDELVWTFSHAEAALEEALKQGWATSTAEHAIRANRAEESLRRCIDERNSNRMIADRVCAEMYRVRDALGVGPGGADLGLQVRDALAGRDAENIRLRAQVATWKAYAADLAENLTIIGPLAWAGIDKGSDVLPEIYDRATIPNPPEVLRDLPQEV
jgi:hypothetical protein